MLQCPSIRLGMQARSVRMYKAMHENNITYKYCMYLQPARNLDSVVKRFVRVPRFKKEVCSKPKGDAAVPTCMRMVCETKKKKLDACVVSPPPQENDCVVSPPHPGVRELGRGMPRWWALLLLFAIQNVFSKLLECMVCHQEKFMIKWRKRDLQLRKNRIQNYKDVKCQPNVK